MLKKKRATPVQLILYHGANPASKLMTVDRTKSHEAALALLWGEPRKRTRGPRPAHSLEDILDKAIGIADREGLGAVCMQRLADEMMFTKMAVYRYVPGRTVLVALMTDRALGPPPTIISPGRWRDRIEAWALAAFTVFLRHPWGLQTTTGDRVIGPNEARWTEVALGILAETGLDGGDRLDILAVTAGHMRSIAQHAAAWGGLENLEGEMQDMFGLMLKGREEKFPELTKSVAESRDGANENNFWTQLHLRRGRGPSCQDHSTAHNSGRKVSSTSDVKCVTASETSDQRNHR